MADVRTLQKQAHDNARAKGWWDDQTGVRVSGCRYTIEVDDGSGPRRWQGDTVEGFQRDLAAATNGRSAR